MIPDNYDLYVAHEAALDRYEKHLPKCACCGEPIRSEKAFDIDGWFCEDCFNNWADQNSTLVENLMEDEW